MYVFVIDDGLRLASFDENDLIGFFELGDVLHVALEL